MNRNLGNRDRILRTIAAVALVPCAVMAPFALYVRMLAFGALAFYLLGTALFGTCVGYRLMGRNTCVLPVRGG